MVTTAAQRGRTVTGCWRKGELTTGTEPTVESGQNYQNRTAPVAIAVNPVHSKPKKASANRGSGNHNPMGIRYRYGRNVYNHWQNVQGSNARYRPSVQRVCVWQQQRGNCCNSTKAGVPGHSARVWGVVRRPTERVAGNKAESTVVQPPVL